MRIAEHAADVYSQAGEDGILSELVRRLGPANLTHWCAEVGAWDGVHLSNTCNLIREHGFRAVLIEASAAKAAEITQHHPAESVVVLNELLRCEGPNRLDGLLARTPIPERFDVMSIDIDGADYWILESMQRYRPKVVVIEFNPTIPNAVRFVQARSTDVTQGSSALSIAELAAEKGYVLVAATSLNLVLVEREYAALVLDPEEAAAALTESPLAALMRLRTDNPNYVFTLYDGSVCTSESVVLPWHGATLPERALFRLPRWFASFPGEWSARRWRCWRAYTRLVLARRPKGDRL